MAYATIEDVQARMTRTLTDDEERVCASLLDDAGILIDAYNEDASADSKKVVSCRMVIRALGDGEMGIPVGATQGSQAGLGYSESWTITNGSVGQLYLEKVEKKMLGVGDQIGASNPLAILTGGDS
jgi:hypothetical protein